MSTRPKFALTFPVSALLASAAIIPVSAQAAQNDADQRDYLPGDIVVTATLNGYDSTDGSSGTKTPTALIDVPQSVTVITQDQLEDQAVRSLNDALRFVPGVSMESGEGHRDEVFIRGQETTADFYIDGLRDDAQYYRSLYNVERVEVLKGANALIFGRGAGGGAINRVAKKARPGQRIAELDLAFGTFGQGAASMDVNLPLGDDAAFRLNSTYEKFDNNRDFYEGDFIGFSPSFAANLGAQTTFTANYTYDRDERTTDRGVPSLNGRPLAGYDNTFFGDGDFNTSQVDAHVARARLEHEFSAGLSANVTVQYADYDKLYANVLPRGTDGTSVDLSGYHDTTLRQNWITQGNLVWQGDTGPIQHTLLLGMEAGWQDTQNARSNALFENNGSFVSQISVPLALRLALPAVSLTAPIRDRASSLETLSFYLQDQIAITDWFEIVAGVRYDEFALETMDITNNASFSRTDELLSPRFGIIVKPQEDLSIYASYSESFLPQSGDQFVSLDSTSAALEPEKFDNLEIGVKWAIQPKLFFTAAIFRLDRSNTRAADPNNSGLTVLTGSSRTKGFEVGLAGSLGSALHLNIGYSYLDGQITSDTTAASAGDRLQQLPKHQIGLWSRYDVTSRLGLGLGVIHQSDQFTSFSHNVVLPAYMRVDAAVFFDVSPRLALQLNVQNLLDETYYASAHGDNNIQPSQPMNATLGLRLHF